VDIEFWLRNTAALRGIFGAHESDSIATLLANMNYERVSNSARAYIMNHECSARVFTG